ncbi:MAG: rod shape-determining protein MreC [Bacteroidales bacterium]|nr:rod shape-determining protein MreC [Bacteroidales bacterium]
MRTLFRLIVKNYFVLLFLFLESISLVLIFQFNPFQKSFFLNVSRNITASINNRLTNIGDYLFLQEENERLNSENVYLRNQLNNFNTTVYLSYPENFTSDTLDISNEDRYFFKPAEIVNSSINKQYNYITINKGESNQLQANMAVISSCGVVGMIIQTSDNFATIQTLLNRNSRVGAKIKGNDYFGILDWDGRSPEYVQLSEIPVHVNINEGDTIVTSGYSSIYPKDLPIGRIDGYQKGQGNFYNIQIQLFVNFRTINHVMVIRNYLQEEQKELEREVSYD